MQLQDLQALTDWVTPHLSAEHSGQGQLEGVVRLNTLVTDLGEPTVIVKNSALPNFGRDLREGLGRGVEEQPEVDIVLDVVRMGQLQPAQAGKVLTNSLVESDHCPVVVRDGGVFRLLE